MLEAAGELALRLTGDIDSLRTASPKVFKLPKVGPANGLSRGSVEAKLAFSTKRLGQCDVAHGTQASTARGAAKRRSSTETKTGKGSAVLQPSKADVSRVAVKLELKSDDETDKSEELSDIINFLIETDPRRNREVYGALDASSDDAERSSSPPGHCKHLDRSPPPPDIKKTRKELEAPTRCEGALATLPVRIVLPAPDIYGFNYQPDFASCVVPRAPSQTSTSSVAQRGSSETSQLGRALDDVEMSEPCDSAEGSMPASGSDRSFEVSDKCQVPSAEEKMHQKAPASPVNNAVAEKSAIANKGCALRDSLIIKPDDISQDTGDSLADAVAHGPVVRANCDDGRADNAAGPVSPAYPDTRPRCAEEDSRVDNASRNDGDHSGAQEERQLRTAAEPEPSPSPRASHVDVNGRRPTELQGGSDVADKAPASPFRETCDETAGDVTLAESECTSVLLSEDRKARSSCERDAESDSTEALQWSPGVASRSNSAEYTEEGVPAADAAGNDAPQNVDSSSSTALPSEPPVADVKLEKESSPLVNGIAISECNDRPADTLASASSRNTSSSDRGLDNIFTVFTTVQEGTIVSVDCKKFRKRGRPIGAKRKHALRRAQMAAMELASRKEDVECTVRQVLHDVVDRIVRTGSEIPSKLSEANIKDVINSFCESNGFRHQDFAGDDDELVFGKVLPDDSHGAVATGKRRRRGSSDQGSSSEHGSVTTRTRQGANGATRKRYKKRETSPTKRMLTRSQWRRSCYQKEQEKKRAAATDHPDNGQPPERGAEDSLPDAKRRRRSVDLTSDMDSSNTESSADAMSLACGTSQDMDLAVSNDDAACNATGESRPARGDGGVSDSDKARVLVAESSSAPLNSSIYLSCEPPKLGYMEASVTTAPRELSSLATTQHSARDNASPRDVDVADVGNRYCAEARGRRRLPPPEYAHVDERAIVGDGVNDDDDDDDGESQLVICDTDDSCYGAPLSVAPSGGGGDGGAWLDDSSADKARAAVVRSELDSSIVHASQRSPLQPAANLARSAVCESEKAAADTGVVCRDEGDDARTLEAVGVAAAAADAASPTHLRSPPTALSVRGSPAAPSACDGSTSAVGEGTPLTTAPRYSSGSHRRTSLSPAPPSRAHHGADLHPWPASLPTSPAAAPSPEVIVVEEEPNDLSVSSRASFVQPLGSEPLDLSLKEQAFRAKADIPVGKVQPQMATASQSASEEALSNSPINYSSSRHSTGAPVEDDGRSRERERRVHGSDSSSASGSQSAGTGSSEPPSDSILQRLLLDPSRKPKESDSSAASSPVQAVLDSRNARGSAETTKDSPKRVRDTDIVTEAKSLLNARLTARHQEQLQQQHSQMAKVSNMASVPPMSFPENKLGMTTLESKIVELKKQIHHLTILATYKEKELACISSLRTAKEDALKQLESKYPGICSVIRAFGTESGSSESGESPGFTDVPSIVAQAATATTDLTSLAGFPSESDAPLQKKPAVQQQQQQPPALPIPLLATASPHRLRANSTSEGEPPGRNLIPYDRGAAPASSPVTARSSVSPRDSRQPRPVPTAPSKSAFSVPSASSSSSSGQRPPRLLLPKGPVPSATPAASPVSQTTASRGANSSALASSAAAPSAAAAAAVSGGWWNTQNGSPLSLTAGLPHHLQREALREYALSSSTAALLKAASVPSSVGKQHGGGVPSLPRHEPSALVSASEAPSRSTHRRLAEAGVPGRSEEARDMAAELARQQEEFNLALGQGNSLAGVNAAAAGAYPLGRAGLSAAASMYNQAMAYNLYQQLRINKEAAEASALLEKMKQNLSPSQQQQLYQKALLEQAKNRPTAWEHLGHMLQQQQKESPSGMQAGLPAELLSLQPKLSTHELPWLQAGLACVNCGDPRVKFVCSCCRTQTFCSEQCQVKLWSKLKTQAPTKN